MGASHPKQPNSSTDGARVKTVGVCSKSRLRVQNRTVIECPSSRKKPRTEVRGLSGCVGDDVAVAGLAVTTLRRSVARRITTENHAGDAPAVFVLFERLHHGMARLSGPSSAQA